MEELKNEIKYELRHHRTRPDKVYEFLLRCLELIPERVQEHHFSTTEIPPAGEPPVVPEEPEPEPVPEVPEPIPVPEPVPEPEDEDVSSVVEHDDDDDDGEITAV